MVKNLPVNAGDIGMWVPFLGWGMWVPFLGWGMWVPFLEKGMATHFNILVGRIPWTEEPGGLPSMGSQRVRHD